MSCHLFHIPGVGSGIACDRQRRTRVEAPPAPPRSPRKEPPKPMDPPHLPTELHLPAWLGLRAELRVLSDVNLAEAYVLYQGDVYVGRLERPGVPMEGCPPWGLYDANGTTLARGGSPRDLWSYWP